MARTSIATDNFNRANGPLGANWASLNNANGADPAIQTNVIGGAVAGGPGGNAAAARWVGTGTFTDDQYSSIVIVEADTGSANYGMGVVARASADTDAARDYYYFAAASNDTYILAKIVNGAETTLASGSQNWVDGDRVEIECQGTTIRGMRNAVTVASVTDSALTTGKPGIAPWGDGFLATGDDWEGGNLTVGDVTVALGGSASTGGSGTTAPGTSIGL